MRQHRYCQGMFRDRHAVRFAAIPKMHGSYIAICIDIDTRSFAIRSKSTVVSSTSSKAAYGIYGLLSDILSEGFIDTLIQQVYVAMIQGVKKQVDVNQIIIHGEHFGSGMQKGAINCQCPRTFAPFALEIGDALTRIDRKKYP